MLAAALTLIASAALLTAEQVILDSFKVGGKTYSKVIVLGVTATDLYFKHDGGITNVKLKYLEPEIQKRFDYDPRTAEEAERRQLQDDAAFQETAAREVAARAQTLPQKAAETPPGAEAGLADPISSQSLLNRPAPKLEFGKWLGERPETQGKAVLIFFWTTWSMSCRRTIPEMNSFQKQFRDQLVVIGLSAQEEREAADFSDVKIDFPLAVDPKSTLAGAAGVTSVPQVLLIDAKGTVRYVGHPAALNSATLKKLLAEPAE
jgi:cytochrome c biogenesis protein CcmG, thiol:disulfide interchange protein DsbE